MSETYSLLTLFLSAFFAATLIPTQSEIGLGYLVLQRNHSTVLLIIIASFGNILGAIVNWIIGRGIAKSVMRMRKIESTQRYKKISIWYQKFGQWTLLLSWVPFIGDPITVIAGIFKVPFKNFLLIVAIAKTTRYVIIAFLVEKIALSS